jgi:Fe-S-cluster containining protein
MDLRFECTMCGQCCRNLKLPLTVQEAQAWLDDGREVQVLCEAMPWRVEPATHDALAQHRRRRSFEARSGALPVRVVAILAASFAGDCPNLGESQQCTIYERRPMVCRIYPAEIRPGLQIVPAHKACPPEAWSAQRPVFEHQGELADASLRALVERSRDADARDVPTKQRLCEALDLRTAALSTEGWVIHTPRAQDLAQALRRAQAAQGAPIGAGDWALVSDRSASLQALWADGATGLDSGAAAQRGVQYRGVPAGAG